MSSPPLLSNKDILDLFLVPNVEDNNSSNKDHQQAHNPSSCGRDKMVCMPCRQWLGTAEFIRQYERQMQIVNDPKKIFIGRVPTFTTDKRLEELFAKFGPIKKIIRFEMQHYALLEFHNEESANKAVEFARKYAILPQELPTYIYQVPFYVSKYERKMD